MHSWIHRSPRIIRCWILPQHCRRQHRRWQLHRRPDCRRNQNRPGPCNSGISRCHGGSRRCTLCPSVTPTVRFHDRDGIAPFPCSEGKFDKIRTLKILHLALGKFSFGIENNRTSFDSPAEFFGLVRRIERTFPPLSEKPSNNPGFHRAFHLNP